jgi:hypothetical protein
VTRKQIERIEKTAKKRQVCRKDPKWERWACKYGTFGCRTQHEVTLPDDSVLALCEIAKQSLTNV